MTSVKVVELVRIQCRLPLVSSFLRFRDLQGADIRPPVGTKVTQTPVGARGKILETIKNEKSHSDASAQTYPSLSVLSRLRSSAFCNKYPNICYSSYFAFS